MTFSRVCGRLADVALIAFLGLLVWSHPQLPERVVSHFGANGPDGWMPKRWFVATFAGTVLGFEAFFRWGLPVMMRRTRGRLVNTPNRSYWSATPERQAEAYAKALAIVGPSRLFMNAIMLVALHACVQASGVPVFVEAPIAWFGIVVGGGSLVFTVAVFAWAFTAFKVPGKRGA